MAPTVGSLVYLVFVIAMIVFNIGGNVLVCLIILKKKKEKKKKKKKEMKAPISWLIFHLAIADLLVAVFFIPPCILASFIEHPSGIIGDLLCKLITGGVSGWAATSASSFLLVAIAFERYNATLHPLKQLNHTRSSWVVPVLWFLGILLVIPSSVVLVYDVDSQMCFENFPDYSATRAYNLIWFFASSALPICIMGYLYKRIISCLRNHVLVPGSCPRSVSQSSKKVTKMLISVSAIFIACWIPPTVLCVLSSVIPGGYGTVHSVSTATALLNSCLNPLVYNLHSQQFRKNLASLVSCCKNK